MIVTDMKHLCASSVSELHEFAKSIGLHRCWFHGVRKGHPHYDVVNRNLNYLKNKEGIWYLELAVKAGAKVITSKELIQFINENKIVNDGK